MFYTAENVLYLREKYFIPRKIFYIAAKNVLYREAYFIPSGDIIWGANYLEPPLIVREQRPF